MLEKKIIITILLFCVTSCTQDLATIEIHKIKNSKYINHTKNSSPLNNNQYIYVEDGETIYSIAIKHNLSYLDISSANNLEWPYTLEIGQKLFLTKQDLITHEEKDVNIEKKLVKESITTEDLDANNVNNSNNKIHIQTATTNFKWPVSGKILSGFGKRNNGTMNDGVYIETPINEPVKATYSGQVIYSGQDLEQYGNLIIISHADQWFSAYAHLSKLSVTKGEKVLEGQNIAMTGDTGNISSPQLYFSLRKDKTPVDPLKYLPKRFEAN